jgi:hypothetical protein
MTRKKMALSDYLNVLKEYTSTCSGGRHFHKNIQYPLIFCCNYLLKERKNKRKTKENDYPDQSV